MTWEAPASRYGPARQTSFAVERCVIRGIPFRYEILLNGLSLSDRAADDLLDTSSVNIDTWA